MPDAEFCGDLEPHQPHGHTKLFKVLQCPGRQMPDAGKDAEVTLEITPELYWQAIATLNALQQQLTDDRAYAAQLRKDTTAAFLEDNAQIQVLQDKKVELLIEIGTLRQQLADVTAERDARTFDADTLDDLYHKALDALADVRQKAALADEMAVFLTKHCSACRAGYERSYFKKGNYQSIRHYMTQEQAEAIGTTYFVQEAFVYCSSSEHSWLERYDALIPGAKGETDGE